MGNISSSLTGRGGGVEVVDYGSNNAYRYPPKAGMSTNYTVLYTCIINCQPLCLKFNSIWNDA